MTKEPGEDGSGGVTFRLGGWARLPNPMKPRKTNPLLRTSMSGDDARTRRVTGGIAWTKWLTTLTGESPASSANSYGQQATACGGNANP